MSSTAGTVVAQSGGSAQYKDQKQDGYFPTVWVRLLLLLYMCLHDTSGSDPDPLISAPMQQSYWEWLKEDHYLYEHLQHISVTPSLVKTGTFLDSMFCETCLKVNCCCSYPLDFTVSLWNRVKAIVHVKKGLMRNSLTFWKLRWEKWYHSQVCTVLLAAHDNRSS